MSKIRGGEWGEIAYDAIMSSGLDFLTQEPKWAPPLSERPPLFWIRFGQKGGSFSFKCTDLLKSCILGSPFWEVQVQYLTRQRSWNWVSSDLILLIWTEMIQKSGILLQNCKPTWPLSHFSCRKCIFAYHFTKIDTLKTVSFLAALRKTWIWWNNC